MFKPKPKTKIQRQLKNKPEMAYSHDAFLRETRDRLKKYYRTRLCDGNMVGYSRIIEQSGICLITFNLIDNNVLNFLG